MATVVQITQLTGDYSDGELEDLEEIYECNYKGTILQEDDACCYCLVAFTFPRYGQPDRATDGLRYVWVSQDDLELI